MRKLTLHACTALDLRYYTIMYLSIVFDALLFFVSLSFVLIDSSFFFLSCVFAQKISPKIANNTTTTNLLDRAKLWRSVLRKRVRQYNTLGQKSAIYPKINNSKFSFLTKFTFLKSHFLTKFTISKSHFSQNSYFQTSNSW